MKKSFQQYPKLKSDINKNETGKFASIGFEIMSTYFRTTVKANENHVFQLSVEIVWFCLMLWGLTWQYSLNSL